MAGSNKKEDNNTDERLLELFQSRAVLKQEYNQLQKDKLLLSKIKEEQEQRIKFLETDLLQLERLLSKPQRYEDIKVYYQLRRLWKTCNRYIHKFRDRLVDQQRDRERKQQLLEFNQNRSQKLSAVNAEINRSKQVLDEVKVRVEQLGAQIQASKPVWQFFTRKRLRHNLATAHQLQTETYSELQALYDKRIKVESEPWPEFDDVDLAGKRSINLAMIALAQFFYMSLTEMGLAHKTFAAHTKRPWELKFGTEAEQQDLIMKCTQKMELFAQLKDLGSEVQTRMTKLKEGIKYKKLTDSIPDPDSIIKLVSDISGTALSATLSDVSLEVNVLTDNYWGLEELMIP